MIERIDVVLARGRCSPFFLIAAILGACVGPPQPRLSEPSDCPESSKTVSVQGAYRFPLSMGEDEARLRGRQLAMRDALLQAGERTVEVRNRSYEKQSLSNFEQNWVSAKAESVRGTVKILNEERLYVTRDGQNWKVSVLADAVVCPSGKTDLPFFASLKVDGRELDRVVIEQAVREGVAKSQFPVVFTADMPDPALNDVALRVALVRYADNSRKLGRISVRTIEAVAEVELKDFFRGAGFKEVARQEAAVPHGERPDRSAISELAFHAVKNATEKVIKKWQDLMAKTGA